MPCLLKIAPPPSLPQPLAYHHPVYPPPVYFHLVYLPPAPLPKFTVVYHPLCSLAQLNGDVIHLAPPPTIPPTMHPPPPQFTPS